MKWYKATHKNRVSTIIFTQKWQHISKWRSEFYFIEKLTFITGENTYHQTKFKEGRDIARGVLGCLWVPICKPFLKKTTYNMGWKWHDNLASNSHADTVWFPPLKNPGYTSGGFCKHERQCYITWPNTKKESCKFDKLRGRGNLNELAGI